MASSVAQVLPKVVNTTADQLAFGPNNWMIYDSETTGATSATLAGEENVQHFVRQVIVSFGAVPASACQLTVKSGSTIIAPPIEIGVLVAGPVVIEFPIALQCAPGATLTVAITTPGAVASTVGAIGFSSPDRTAFSA